mgnify:CR=1 FL=1
MIVLVAAEARAAALPIATFAEAAEATLAACAAHFLMTLRPGAAVTAALAAAEPFIRVGAVTVAPAEHHSAFAAPAALAVMVAVPIALVAIRVIFAMRAVAVAQIAMLCH